VNKTSFSTSLQPIIDKITDKYLVKLNDTLLKTVQNCPISTVWLTIIPDRFKHYPLSMGYIITLFIRIHTFQLHYFFRHFITGACSCHGSLLLSRGLGPQLYTSNPWPMRAGFKLIIIIMSYIDRVVFTFLINNYYYRQL
jgi:hypothetical protein